MDRLWRVGAVEMGNHASPDFCMQYPARQALIRRNRSAAEVRASVGHELGRIAEESEHCDRVRRRRRPGSNPVIERDGSIVDLFAEVVHVVGVAEKTDELER
jgi:hypothetical protein